MSREWARTFQRAGEHIQRRQLKRKPRGSLALWQLRAIGREASDARSARRL
jgi:hypothetical protein